MGRKLAAVAIASLFAIGALSQTADARLVYAHTKIVNLHHSSSGGVTYITGEIKVDAIDSRCGGSRDVRLVVNGVQRDTAYTSFDKPHTFSMDWWDTTGTWRINVLKFKDEKTKICLGTHKEFTE